MSSKRVIFTGEVLRAMARGEPIFQVNFRWKGEVVSFEEAKALVEENLGKPVIDEEDYCYWTLDNANVVVDLSLMDMFPKKECEGTLVISLKDDE